MNEPWALIGILKEGHFLWAYQVLAVRLMRPVDCTSMKEIIND